MRYDTSGSINHRGGRTALSLATCFALLVCAAAFADLTADPSTVTFASLKQSFAIKLAANGKPVPAGDIQEWKLMASDHDYRRMIRCQKKDGELLLSASDALEVGTYDLIVKTKAGTATIKVNAPLNEHKDVVDKVAAEAGVSPEEARKKLGLTTDPKRATVKIDLPAQYYVGQTLEVEMPYVANHVYTWKMNGKPVPLAVGENKLSFTFPAPGDYELTYVEQENGATIATAKVKTKAVPMPETKK